MVFAFTLTVSNVFITMIVPGLKPMMSKDDQKMLMFFIKDWKSSRLVEIKMQLVNPNW
jgi:hypothetical protein